MIGSYPILGVAPPELRTGGASGYEFVRHLSDDDEARSGSGSGRGARLQSHHRKSQSGIRARAALPGPLGRSNCTSLVVWWIYFYYCLGAAKNTGWPCPRRRRSGQAASCLTTGRWREREKRRNSSKRNESRKNTIDDRLCMHMHTQFAPPRLSIFMFFSPRGCRPPAEEARDTAFLRRLVVRR